jgi:hypothetical protein
MSDEELFLILTTSSSFLFISFCLLLYYLVVPYKALVSPYKAPQIFSQPLKLAPHTSGKVPL